MGNTYIKTISPNLATQAQRHIPKLYFKFEI
jgi:hypothetical protein